MLLAGDAGAEPSEAQDRLVLSMQASCRTLISFVNSKVRVLHCRTAGYLSFHSIAQCAVHALRSQKHNIFSMGPKLRYPYGTTEKFLLAGSIVRVYLRDRRTHTCPCCLMQVISSEAKGLVSVAVLEVGVIVDISHMFTPLWQEMSRLRLFTMKKMRDSAVEESKAARAAAELALTVRRNCA